MLASQKTKITELFKNALAAVGAPGEHQNCSPSAPNSRATVTLPAQWRSNVQKP